MSVRDLVRQHYDEFGWQVAFNGRFEDARFVDTRGVMATYYEASDEFIRSRLIDSGIYFLDAGCGANPASQFSQGYSHHVCADISRRGLQEARSRLGNRGLYVLADVTRLPFANATFDGVLNGYSLFHIERGDQCHAVEELARVLRPDRTGVILYGKASDRVLKRLARRLRGLSPIGSWRSQGTTSVPELYYYAHTIAWFRVVLSKLSVANIQIDALRVLGPTLSRFVIPNNQIGAMWVRGLVWLEHRLRRPLARHATHISISFRKARSELSRS